MRGAWLACNIAPVPVNSGQQSPRLYYIVTVSSSQASSSVSQNGQYAVFMTRSYPSLLSQPRRRLLYDKQRRRESTEGAVQGLRLNEGLLSGEPTAFIYCIHPRYTISSRPQGRSPK